MVDEESGYRCPPKNTQFKPGNNANPLGRGARKRLKPNQIVRKFLDRLETVSVGGKRTKMTVLQRLILRHGNDALKGNVESALLLLELRKYAENLGDTRPITIVIPEFMTRL